MILTSLVKLKFYNTLVSYHGFEKLPFDHMCAGSKAMHSHIIEIFSEETKSKKSTAQNLAITLQRRYRNVLVDSKSQKQLEMFLGLRHQKHFPTLPDLPLQVSP